MLPSPLDGAPAPERRVFGAGIPKSNTAALLDPLFATVAEDPGVSVVVVPAAIVAAVPVAPTSPRGIVKLNTAAELEPEFVTDADVPGDPVVVVPAATVAAAPASPFDASKPHHASGALAGTGGV